MADDEIILSELSDDELVEQMHDDICMTACKEENRRRHKHSA